MCLCEHVFELLGWRPREPLWSLPEGCVRERGAGALGLHPHVPWAPMPLASGQGEGGFWEGAAAGWGGQDPLSMQEEDLSEQGLISHTKDLGTGGLLVRRDSHSGAGGRGPIVSFLPPTGLPHCPTWDTSPVRVEWQPGPLTSCYLVSPEQRRKALVVLRSYGQPRGQGQGHQRDSNEEVTGSRKSHPVLKN